MADIPQHPALQGYSPNVQAVKHTLGSTLKTALKGALIGGLVLGAIALPAAAIPAFGSFITNGWLANGAAGALIGKLLTTGILAGASIGGAIGFVSGVNNAEDAVEDEAQDRISRFNRAQQMAANQEMMAMNMERMRASRMGAGASNLAHGLGMQGKNNGQGMGITG